MKVTVGALIFSRDRPAQLDLLLSSIEQNAPNYFDSIVVLHLATSAEYLRGYKLCKQLHPDVQFVPEHHFREQSLIQVKYCRDLVCALCDDDIFYRRLLGRYPEPDNVLDWEPEVFTFALRLGENVTYCYPLRSEQQHPAFARDNFEGLTWDWQKGHLDWAYVGSLDGNVYRADQLFDLLRRCFFTNPSEMEDALVRACYQRDDTPPLAVCYTESIVVNTPANRTSDTHQTNRFGDVHRYDVAELNRRFVAGERLSLNDMDFRTVNGAHTELELVWA